MARVHGFRIFVVKAYPNRRAGNDPLDVSSASWVRNEIFEMLESLASKGTQFFDPPEPRELEEPRRPTRSITVSPPVAVQNDLIHVGVSIGETGSHAEATRKGKQPKKLKKYSPEATHFITFVFPKQTAEEFIVVAQTIRRRDPLVRLMALLKAEGIERRDERIARDKDERRRLRALKQEVPEAQKFVRPFFDWVQAADNRYLSEILGKASHASVTFTSTAPSSRGSRADQLERTLTVRLLNEKNRSLGRDVARTWMARRRAGDETSRAQGVSELADVMEDNDLLKPDEGSMYDRVSVSLRDDENQSTTIAVDTLRDVFTYPVSEGTPTVLYYYERVAGRVQIVAQEERIEVRAIDPGEVLQCLDD